MEQSLNSSRRAQGANSNIQPQLLKKQEFQILQEPDIYRKRGEKVEDALYRDHLKRQARSKLLQESKQYQDEKERTVKIPIKSQQMAVQRFERDLEQLIKKFSTVQQADDKPKSIFAQYDRNEDSRRTVTKNELIRLFREVEVFKELNAGNEEQKSVKSRSVSPIQPGQRSIQSHRRVDSYRKTQRLKQELNFLNTLWNTLLSPDKNSQNQEADFEYVNEALKILFNHYLSNSKQAQLLSELQKLVYSFASLPSHTQYSESQFEEYLIKPFQSLYQHYFTLNNITKAINQERVLKSLKEHYKENTFHPKINPLSANMDLQNISQIYAKLSAQTQSNRGGATAADAMKQARPITSRQEEEPSIEDLSDKEESKSQKRVALSKARQLSGFNFQAHSRQNSDLAQSKTTHARLEVRGNQKSLSRNQAQSPRTVLTNSNKKSDNRGHEISSYHSISASRFEHLYQQKDLQKDKLKQQQQEKVQQELEECTFKPKISPYQSHKMIQLRLDDTGSVTLPQHVSPARRYEQMYQEDIKKRQHNLKKLEELKQEEDQRKLAECTFQPKISTSQSRQNFANSKTPPQRIVGYDDTIQRMRQAHQERLRQKEAFDNLGRVKSLSKNRGSTPTQPFRLSYQFKDKLASGRSSARPDNSVNQSLNQIKPSQNRHNFQQNKESEEEQVLLMMEILVKQGQKVQLKVKKNDDPQEVASNFAKIYRLNQRSQNALAQIISEQLAMDNISNNQRASQQQPQILQQIRQTNHDDDVEEPEDISDNEHSKTRQNNYNSGHQLQCNQAQFNLSNQLQQNQNQGRLDQILQRLQQEQQTNDLFTTSQLRNNQLQRDDSADFGGRQRIQNNQIEENQIDEDEESREETDVIDDDDDSTSEQMQSSRLEESRVSDNFPIATHQQRNAIHNSSALKSHNQFT